MNQRDIRLLRVDYINKEDKQLYSDNYFLLYWFCVPFDIFFFHEFTSFNYKKIIKHQATAVITIKIYDLIFLVKKHISIMRSKGKSNK